MRKMAGMDEKLAFRAGFIAGQCAAGITKKPKGLHQLIEQAYKMFLENRTELAQKQAEEARGNDAPQPDNGGGQFVLDRTIMGRKRR